jgi:hypothetical protein
VQTKELRLALVCYGGVSLAVYMHGLTKEVWKLTRASMRRHAPDAGDLPPARDSEIVYQALLDAIPGLDLRVMCDIVAGASAGGINGVLLARAAEQCTVAGLLAQPTSLHAVHVVLARRRLGAAV